MSNLLSLLFRVVFWPLCFCFDLRELVILGQIWWSFLFFSKPNAFRFCIHLVYSWTLLKKGIFVNLKICLNFILKFKSWLHMKFFCSTTSLTLPKIPPLPHMPPLSPFFFLSLHFLLFFPSFSPHHTTSHLRQPPLLLSMTWHRHHFLRPSFRTFSPHSFSLFIIHFILSSCFYFFLSLFNSTIGQLPLPKNSSHP